MKMGRLGYPAMVILLCSTVLLFCHIFSRTVTVMAEQEQESWVLVIDPGHGGVDGGATSCTGKLESGYNLEISLRLNDLFHLLGYRTKMIRTTDTSIYTSGDTIAKQKMSDLKERVKIANASEKQLLLSIHQNNFSDSKYSGAQVFYPDTEGSWELAEQLQSAFVSTLNPGSKRRCKKAEGVYLMEHIECPGVLIECGFLSNPEEEGKLNSPEYQRKLCCTIAVSVINWISNT